MMRLDTFVKRLEITKKVNILDKRRFRTKKSERELLNDKLSADLDFFGVYNKEQVLQDLIRVKNYENLNFQLLIIVYLYFSEKNFEIGNVVLDFDKDFKKEVEKVKERGIFDLEKKETIYKFRQDFIIYLLLINDSTQYEDLDYGVYQEEEESEYVDNAQEDENEYNFLETSYENNEDEDYDYYSELVD